MSNPNFVIADEFTASEPKWFTSVPPIAVQDEEATMNASLWTGRDRGDEYRTNTWFERNVFLRTEDKLTFIGPWWFHLFFKPGYGALHILKLGPIVLYGKRR